MELLSRLRMSPMLMALILLALMVAVWVAQVLLQVDVAHAAHNPCGGWMPDDPHWLVDANCTPPPPYYPGPPGT